MSIYTEQVQPHNLEAEHSVIGSILIDNQTYAEVAGIITPNDFYRENNRLCYQACANLYARNQGIDQVTLARELERLGSLQEIGGMPYLSDLVAQTPTSVHARYYAELIAHSSEMRRLITAGSDIVTIAYEDQLETTEALNMAHEKLYRIRAQQPGQGFTSLRTVYDEFLQEQADREDPANSSLILTSGFLDLDELLGGLQRSDMIIMGARPGLGKSALAVNIAVNIARTGSAVGIFSLEMSREQLGLRILSSEAEVNSHRLRLNLITEDEQERMMNAIGSLSELPIYIDDTPVQTINDIKAKSNQLASQEPRLDMLIIDYLQLISGQARNRTAENRVQEISEISRNLKAIARDLHIPLITCSQLSRTIESRTGHRPMLSDLRDSGSIEQDADIVMFIHRDDKYYTEEEWNIQFHDRPYPRDIAEIIVAKQRHGPIGSISLHFNNLMVRFETMLRAPRRPNAGENN